MKLHFDCAMGAAGDMITAALYELLPDKAAFLTKFRTALAACPALDGAEILPEASVKCAIAGTHMRVTVRGEEEISDDVSGHAHTRAHAYTHIHSHARVHERGGKNYSYTDILALISGLALSDKAKSDAKGVFALIARAEAKVHGLAPDALSNVHFHELGSLDALIDVTAVCALMDELSVTEVTSSPVHVGAGAVRTAHGVLPVPTPATAELLLGVPSYGGSIRGELCTPTGAALLRYFVSRFGEMSVTPLKIGYGMGSKDFDRCNCVRAFLCDDGASETDTICRLECNLDDMTPENIGFAQGALLTAGALDAFTTAIGMKKNRSAVMLTVLCRAAEQDKFTRLVFRHTTTLGVRRGTVERAVLSRSEHTRETKYGPVRVKRSEGWGVTREKPEYDDLAEIARREGCAIYELDL